MGLEYINTPIGTLKIRETDGFITEINIASCFSEESSPSELTKEAAKQIAEYFSKKRIDFDFPFSPTGTVFQNKVWSALTDVPYGQTRSYGEIAASINSPKACRAVGMACNKNKLLIVIPCHRIVGANGDLTGFGAGINAKEWLLRHEGI